MGMAKARASRTCLEPSYPSLMIVFMGTSSWLIPRWEHRKSMKNNLPVFGYHLRSCNSYLGHVAFLNTLVHLVFFKEKLGYTLFSLWDVNVKIWLIAHKSISTGTFVIAYFSSPLTIVLTERDRIFFVLLVRLRVFRVSLFSAVLLLYLYAVLLSLACFALVMERLSETFLRDELNFFSLGKVVIEWLLGIWDLFILLNDFKKSRVIKIII